MRLTDEKPLISCLCPTYNRPRFIPLLVETFLAQTYPNLELVVLDDGEPIADLLPDDPRIRYVHLDDKLALGAKWNVLASLARGEILHFMSDDDWRHSRLVELLYQQLRTSDEKAMATALRELSYVDLFSGDRWIFRAEDAVSDGPLMLYKELWRKGTFRDHEGENSLDGWQDIWHDACETALVGADGLRAKDLYIATRHAGNTWHGHFAGDALWRRDPDPIKLPAFLGALIMDPEIGARPPRRDHHIVSFKVMGFSGLDGFLHSVLPARMFARRVARKIIGPGGLYHNWDFSDDTGELVVETGEGAFRVINARGDVAQTSGLGVPVL